MRRLGVYALLLFGVFYFSEGKPCPEKTRPHKTRCDVYYKCQELPARTHVWVPTKCEEGLIYERHLKLCVLPEDDWECYPQEEDAAAPGIPQGGPPAPDASTPDAPGTRDSSDVVIVRDDRGPEPLSPRIDDSVQLVADGSLSSEEEDDEDDDSEQSAQQDDDDEEEGGETQEEEENDGSDYESSGNGEAMTQVNGILQAETKTGSDLAIDIEQKQPKEPQTEAENEPEPDSTPSRIDPKLTAHLQRLSQLIDGLKQTYQSQDSKQTDLRPDQLNAFLAHFNINNKFNQLDPEQDYRPSAISSTTPPPPPSSTTARAQRPASPKNKTDLQEHPSNQMQPETKVELSSSLPKRYATGSGGYSNSQIVVNHPEGSVLFSLPPYGSDAHYGDHSQDYSSHYSPKISEDTLKTVLELSKQMISTQNVPKVIPNPAFYPQPILQPLFLSTAAFGGSPQSPFSSYLPSSNTHSNHNGDYEDDNDYGFPSPTPTYYKPQGHKHGHKKQRPGGYAKPGTTIIHNNVIPLHVNAGGSGEKDVLDSYGQSLAAYPPLGPGDHGNGGGYQVSTSGGINSNQIVHQSHRFENNKFVASVTTMRPAVSSTPATRYSGQYPSPYPTEISVTTMRPFEFHPSPSTVAEFYTPSPHLNDNNVNELYRPSDHYPTVHYTSGNNNNLPRPIDPNRQQSSVYQQMERPSQHQQQQHQQLYSGSQGNLNTLFPTIASNKVKIRPNSQKVESMEDVSEEVVSYDERPSSSGSQLGSSYSYSSNIGGQSVQQQLAQSQFVDQLSVLTSSSSSSSSVGGSNKQKHPYMPRPTPSTSFGATISIASNKPSQLAGYGGGGMSSSHEGAQLVNVGGNFIRYDVFQNTILPLLGHSPTGDDLNNVEVITCATGVRQPNATDCTRYYVCSKKDGKVLSYSCPPFTAFNAQTRICDAYSYTVCAPGGLASGYNSVTENKRLQLEALQALQEAKRRREQAIKAQNIANLLQQYGSQLNVPGLESEASGSQEKDVLNTYVQQAASLASVVSSTPKPAKKRKYYCKEGDKIPDQTSIYSYFVCYKNAQGQMKGHKMTCSKGLLFCPKSSMCTLATKCS